MNRDRGMKKWTAMMLPEHVHLLQEWKKENIGDKQPEVDEWLLQEYAEKIQQAWELGEFVRVGCWYQNRRHQYEGKIVELHPLKRTLLLEGIDGCHHSVNVDTIYEVSIIEWDVTKDDFFR